MIRQAHRREKAALKRSIRRNKPQRYSVERSPLWRLSSIHLLANLLRLEVDDLRRLGGSPSYAEFVDTKGKKERRVQEPLGATMRAHYRLLRLLDSVQRPAYLHSATRKRSSISNATAHKGAANFVATDIQDFYESTTYVHVRNFFKKSLGWSHDLAVMVARLCTIHDHLPTGSCLSPLLSYFVHRELFDSIESDCKKRGFTLTLYIDDITISGTGASLRFLREVKGKILRSDLKTHKDRVAAGLLEITGAVVVGKTLRLPNRQHEAVVELISDVSNGELEKIDRLQGKLTSANMVDPSAANQLAVRYERALSAAGAAERPVNPSE